MSGGLLGALRFVSPIRPRMVQVAPKALSVATELRGGSQRAQDLLGQLRNRPGIKASDTLDELQSDPLEVLGAKHPAMRNIYSLLGQTAIESAAQADIPSVYFPTAQAIGSVRPAKHYDFYKKIYDDVITRDVLAPLERLGLKITGSENSLKPDFNVVNMTADQMEAIRRGELLPGYRHGGPV